MFFMIPFRSVSIDLTTRSDEKPGRQQKGGDDLSCLPVVLPAIAIENHLLVLNRRGLERLFSLPI
jgi:hypothetical protein